MDVASYPPPVDTLLNYGDGREVGRNIKDWFLYLELGLGPEHIPDLIHMATDPELRWADSDSLEVWAPIHAWRALGQLHAEAAIEPLIPLFAEAEDDNWVMEELPEVFGMIGPAAIPAVTAYVVDESHLDWARICASSCFAKIGMMHPEARDECINALSEQLELFEDNDLELNGFLVSDLIDLKAVEAAPVIERAFASGYVEPAISGDWYDVQVLLGLKTREEAKQERSSYYNSLLESSARSSTNAGTAFPTSFSGTSTHKSKADHKKSKYKMAKQSRKKNRKRK